MWREEVRTHSGGHKRDIVDDGRKNSDHSWDGMRWDADQRLQYC